MTIFECEIAMDEWTRTIRVRASSLEEATEIAKVRAEYLCGDLKAVYPIETKHA